MVPQAKRENVDDDELYRTPAHVSWAVAAATAPLPFLGVYAVLFLVHGLLHPVSPPDITSSRSGESLAGVIALALFVVGCLTLSWFVNRRRRWPFLLGQLATLITALDFLIDPTKGGRGVALVLLLTSLSALVLGLHPVSWRHMGREVPFRARRARGPAAGPVPAAAGDVPGPGDAGGPGEAADDVEANRYVGRRRAAR